jgi:hypothetical protein
MQICEHLLRSARSADFGGGGDDPEYWQKRAEEARTLAEQMMDTHTKSLMLGIAASYEKMASGLTRAKFG